MAKAKKEDAPQRLPGAEGECISREQQEILEWLRKVKFRKKLLGGVDEVQLWKKLEELYGLYANAIRAERARYDALLALSGADAPALQKGESRPHGEALASSSERGGPEGAGEGGADGEGKGGGA